LRGSESQGRGQFGGSPGVEGEGQTRRDGKGQGPWVDSVVQFAGSRERLEWTAVPAAGFRLHALPAPRLLRRPRWRLALSLLTLPWRMAWACAAALGLLLRLRPRVVLGTGGYVALPACLAALLLRIPLVLQVPPHPPLPCLRMHSSFRGMHAPRMLWLRLTFTSVRSFP